MNTEHQHPHATPDGEVEPCGRVRLAVQSGASLTPDLMAHARECSVCASVMGMAGEGAEALALTEPDADAAVLETIESALGTQLQRDTGVRAWLRSRPTGVRVAIVVAGAAVMPMLMLLASRRADFSVYPRLRQLLDLMLLVVPMTAALLVWKRPLFRRSPPPWLAPALVLAAVVAVVVLVRLPVAHWDHPASRLGIADDLPRRALACFLTGLVSGLPTLVLLSLVSRRGVRWGLGGLAAIFAALVGGLAVYLHCPLTSLVHLTLGHATILVPFLLVALVVDRLR